MYLNQNGTFNWVKCSQLLVEIVKVLLIISALLAKFGERVECR